MAVAVVLLAPGCGGSSSDANADHERSLTSGMGLEGTVHCSGPECRVTTLQPLATEDEAWLVALPVVAAVNDDPDLAAVRALGLTVMNREGTREARFSCSFPADRTSTSSGAPTTTTVELVHELCEGSFSGF